MISLSRHIELLLLEHNCVIVPGLGGFIANTASAVYNDGPDGDKLFMPPYRTIAFNPQLQVNDGLLVQSYMQAYDASYPAAYLQMEKEIDQLNMQLNLFGEYNMEGIGTLHKSLGQNVVLTSPEAGILTPSLYGIYSFGIRSLAEVAHEREIQNAASQSNIMPIQTETDFNIQEKLEEKKLAEEKIVIPIKKKHKKTSNHNYWYDLAVAASIAGILFMAFLIPNVRNMKGEKETVVAGSIYTNTETQKPKEINTDKKKESSVNTSAVETKQDNKVNKPAETEQEIKSEVEKNYTIVLASFVTEKNSNILIQSLSEQGLKEGRFVKNGKTTRVIYSAYETEEEARTALISLREQNTAFNEAWTMKMN